jgi:hypothetical protein
MLAAGMGALGLGLVASLAASFATEHHLYLYWLAPLLTLVLTLRWVNRKRHGETILFVPPRAGWFDRIRMSFEARHQDDWADLWVVEKSTEPSLYRKLAILDACMWVSVLGLQLYLISGIDHAV